MRIAAANAKMGVNFTKLGIHPGMACTHFLPQVISPQNANRMIMTGDLFSGTDAHAMGLVIDTAVDASSCVADAIDLARKIACNSPVAVRQATHTLRTRMEVGLEAALWREADTQSIAYAGKHCPEGITAIEEKRAPVFGDFE